MSIVVGVDGVDTRMERVEAYKIVEVEADVEAVVAEYTDLRVTGRRLV